MQVEVHNGWLSVATSADPGVIVKLEDVRDARVWSGGTISVRTDDALHQMQLGPDDNVDEARNQLLKALGELYPEDFGT